MDSLTMQLGQLMQKGWPGSSTIGPIGCSITDVNILDWNSERVVPEANRAAVGRIQWDLEQTYQPQKAVNDWIAEYRQRNGHNPSLRERAEGAFQAPQVVTFFQQLIAKAGPLLQPPGTGFCIAPSGPC